MAARERGLLDSIMRVFVWVWSLVFQIEGETVAEGVWELRAEEDVWA